MWPKKFVDGQIVNVLTSVLGQYVILDQDQLNLSLWSGTVELRNLAIRPDVLSIIAQRNNNNTNNNATSAASNNNAAAVDNNGKNILEKMKLERGTIDLCKVTVPYTSLDSEPLVVEIEGIDLRFSIDIQSLVVNNNNNNNNNNNSSEDDDTAKMRSLALEAFEVAKKQSLELFKTILAASTSGQQQSSSSPSTVAASSSVTGTFFEGLGSIIKNNIRFAAKRLSCQLNVVDNNNNNNDSPNSSHHQKHLCSVQLRLSDILSVTTDSTWQPRFIVPPASYEQQQEEIAASSTFTSDNQDLEDRLYQFRSLSLDNLSVKIVIPVDENQEDDEDDTTILELPSATGSLFMKKAFFPFPSSSSSVDDDFSFRFFQISNVFVDVEKVEELYQKLRKVVLMKKSVDSSGQKHQSELVVVFEPLTYDTIKSIRKSVVWNLLRDRMISMDRLKLMSSNNKELLAFSKIQKFCALRRKVVEIEKQRFIGGTLASSPSPPQFPATLLSEFETEEQAKFCIALGVALVKQDLIRVSKKEIEDQKANKQKSVGANSNNNNKSSEQQQAPQAQNQAGWLSWMWGSGGGQSSATQQQTTTTSATSAVNKTNQLSQHQQQITPANYYKMTLHDLVASEFIVEGQLLSEQNHQEQKARTKNISFDVKGIRNFIIQIPKSIYSLRLNTSSISFQKDGAKKDSGIEVFCSEQFVVSVYARHQEQKQEGQQRRVQVNTSSTKDLILLSEIEISNKTFKSSSSNNNDNNDEDEKDQQSQQRRRPGPAIHLSLSTKSKSVRIGTVSARTTLDDELVTFIHQLKQVGSFYQQKSKAQIEELSNETASPQRKNNGKKPLTTTTAGGVGESSSLLVVTTVSINGISTLFLLPINENITNSISASASDIHFEKSNNDKFVSLRQPAVYVSSEQHKSGQQRMEEIVAELKLDANIDIDEQLLLADDREQNKNHHHHHHHHHKRQRVISFLPLFHGGDISLQGEIVEFVLLQKSVEYAHQNLMNLLLTMKQQKKPNDDKEENIIIDATPSSSSHPQEVQNVIEISFAPKSVQQKNVSSNKNNNNTTRNPDLIVNFKVRHPDSGSLHLESRVMRLTSTNQNEESTPTSSSSSSSSSSTVWDIKSSSAKISLIRVSLNRSKSSIRLLETSDVMILRRSSQQNIGTRTDIVFSKPILISLIATVAPLIRDLIKMVHRNNNNNNNNDTYQSENNNNNDTRAEKSNANINSSSGISVECQQQIQLHLHWSCGTIIARSFIYGSPSCSALYFEKDPARDLSTMNLQVANIRIDALNSRCGEFKHCLTIDPHHQRQRKRLMLSKSGFAPLLHCVEVVQQNDEEANNKNCNNNNNNTIATSIMKNKPSNLTSAEEEIAAASRVECKESMISVQVVDDAARNNSISVKVAGSRNLADTANHQNSSNRVILIEQWQEAFGAFAQLADKKNLDSPLQMIWAASTKSKQQKHKQNSPSPSHHHSAAEDSSNNRTINFEWSSGLFLRMPFWGEVVETNNNKNGNSFSNTSQIIEAPILFAERITAQIIKSSTSASIEGLGLLTQSSSSSPFVKINSQISINVNQRQQQQPQEQQEPKKTVIISFTAPATSKAADGASSTHENLIQFSSSSISDDLSPLLASSLSNVFWSSENEQDSITHVMKNNNIHFVILNTTDDEDSSSSVSEVASSTSTSSSPDLRIQITSSSKTTQHRHSFLISIPTSSSHEEKHIQQQQQQQHLQSSSSWIITIPSINYQRDIYSSEEGTTNTNNNNKSSGSRTTCNFPEGITASVSWSGLGAARIDLGKEGTTLFQQSKLLFNVMNDQPEEPEQEEENQNNNNNTSSSSTTTSLSEAIFQTSPDSTAQLNLASLASLSQLPPPPAPNAWCVRMISAISVASCVRAAHNRDKNSNKTNERKLSSSSVIADANDIVTLQSSTQFRWNGRIFGQATIGSHHDHQKDGDGEENYNNSRQHQTPFVDTNATYFVDCQKSNNNNGSDEPLESSEQNDSSSSSSCLLFIGSTENVSYRQAEFDIIEQEQEIMMNNDENEEEETQTSTTTFGSRARDIRLHPSASLTLGKLCRVLSGGVQSPTVFASLVNGARFAVELSKQNHEDDTFTTLQQQIHLGDICMHSVTQAVKFATWMQIQQDLIVRHKNTLETSNQQVVRHASSSPSSSSSSSSLSVMVNHFLIDDVNTSKLASISRIQFDRDCNESSSSSSSKTFSLSVLDALGLIQKGSSLIVQGTIDANTNNRVITFSTQQQQQQSQTQQQVTSSTVMIKPGICVSASLVDRVFAIKERFTEVIEEFKQTQTRLHNNNKQSNNKSDHEQQEGDKNHQSSSSSPSTYFNWNNIQINLLDMGGIFASIHSDSGSVSSDDYYSEKDSNKKKKNIIADNFVITTYEGREQHNNIRVISSLQCSKKSSSSHIHQQQQQQHYCCSVKISKDKRIEADFTNSFITTRVHQPNGLVTWITRAKQFATAIKESLPLQQQDCNANIGSSSIVETFDDNHNKPTPKQHRRSLSASQTNNQDPSKSSTTSPSTNNNSNHLSPAPSKPHHHKRHVSFGATAINNGASKTSSSTAARRSHSNEDDPEIDEEEKASLASPKLSLLLGSFVLMIDGLSGIEICDTKALVCESAHSKILKLSSFKTTTTSSSSSSSSSTPKIIFFSHHNHHHSDLRKDLFELTWRSIELKKRSARQQDDQGHGPATTNFIGLIRPHFKVVSAPRTLIMAVERTYQRVIHGIVHPARVAGILFVASSSSTSYSQQQQQQMKNNNNNNKYSSSPAATPNSSTSTIINASEFQFSYESISNNEREDNNNNNNGNSSSSKRIKLALVVETVHGAFTSTPSNRFDTVDTTVDGVHVKLTSSFVTDDDDIAGKNVSHSAEIDRNLIRKFSCRLNRSDGHHMLQLSTSEIFAMLPTLQNFHQKSHHHHQTQTSTLSISPPVVTFSEFIRFLRVAIIENEEEQAKLEKRFQRHLPRSALVHHLARRHRKTLLAQAQSHNVAAQQQHQAHEPVAVRSAAANQLANFSIFVPCFIIVLSPYSTSTTKMAQQSSNATTTSIINSGTGAASLEMIDLRASAQLLGNTRITEFRIHSARPVTNLSSAAGYFSSSSSSSASSLNQPVISFAITKENEQPYSTSSTSSGISHQTVSPAVPAATSSSSMIPLPNNANSTTTASSTSTNAPPAVSLTIRTKQATNTNDHQVMAFSSQYQQQKQPPMTSSSSPKTTSPAAVTSSTTRLSDRVPDREVSVNALIGGRVDFSFDANHLDQLLDGFFYHRQQQRGRSHDHGQQQEEDDDSNNAENKDEEDEEEEEEEEQTDDADFYHTISSDMELWVDETIGAQGTKSWKFSSSSSSDKQQQQQQQQQKVPTKTSAINIQGRNRSTSGPQQVFPTIFIDIHNTEHFLPIRVEEGLCVFFSNVNFVIMLDPSELIHLARCKMSGQVPSPLTVLLEYCVQMEGHHAFFNLNPTNCRVEYQMKHVPGLVMNINNSSGTIPMSKTTNNKSKSSHREYKNDHERTRSSASDLSTKNRIVSSSADSLVNTTSDVDEDEDDGKKSIRSHQKSSSSSSSSSSDYDNDNLGSDEERQQQERINLRNQRQQRVDPHFLLSARNLQTQQRKMSSSANASFASNTSNPNNKNNNQKTPAKSSSASGPNNNNNHDSSNNNKKRPKRTSSNNLFYSDVTTNNDRNIHGIIDDDDETDETSCSLAYTEGLQSTVFKVHVSIPYGVSIKVGLPSPQELVVVGGKTKKTSRNNNDNNAYYSDDESSPTNEVLSDRNTWWVVATASTAEINTDGVCLSAAAHSPAHDLLFSSLSSFAPTASSSSASTLSSWSTIAKGITKCSKHIPVEIHLTRSSVFDFAGVTVAVAGAKNFDLLVNSNKSRRHNVNKSSYHSHHNEDEDAVFLAPLFAAPTSIMVQVSSAEQKIDASSSPSSSSTSPHQSSSRGHRQRHQNHSTTSSSSPSSPFIQFSPLNESSSETAQVVLEPIRIISSLHMIASLTSRIKYLIEKISVKHHKEKSSLTSFEEAMIASGSTGSSLDINYTRQQQQRGGNINKIQLSPKKHLHVTLPSLTVEVCPYLNLIQLLSSSPSSMNNNNHQGSNGDHDHHPLHHNNNYSSSGTTSSFIFPSGIDLIRATGSFEAVRPCVSLSTLQIDNLAVRSSTPSDWKNDTGMFYTFVERFTLHGARYNFGDGFVGNNNNKNMANRKSSSSSNKNNNNDDNEEDDEALLIHNVEFTQETSTLCCVRDIVPFFPVSSPTSKDHSLTVAAIMFDIQSLVESTTRITKQFSHLLQRPESFANLFLDELGGLEFRNLTGLDVMLKMSTMTSAFDDSSDNNNNNNSTSGLHQRPALPLLVPASQTRNNSSNKSKPMKGIVITPPAMNHFGGDEDNNDQDGDDIIDVDENESQQSQQQAGEEHNQQTSTTKKRSSAAQSSFFSYMIWSLLPSSSSRSNNNNTSASKNNSSGQTQKRTSSNNNMMNNNSNFSSGTTHQQHQTDILFAPSSSRSHQQRHLLTTESHPVELFFPDQSSEPFLMRLDIDWLNRSVQLVSTFRITIASNDFKQQQQQQQQLGNDKKPTATTEIALLLGSNFEDILSQMPLSDKEASMKSMSSLISALDKEKQHDDDDDSSSSSIVLLSTSSLPSSSSSLSIDVPYNDEIYCKPLTILLRDENDDFYISSSASSSSHTLIPGARSIDSLRFILDQRRLMCIENLSKKRSSSTSSSLFHNHSSKIQESFVVPLSKISSSSSNVSSSSSTILPLVLHSGSATSSCSDFVSELTIAPLMSVHIDPILRDLGLTASIVSFGGNLFASSSSSSSLLFNEATQTSTKDSKGKLMVRLSIDSIKQFVIETIDTAMITSSSSSSPLHSTVANIGGANVVIDLVRMVNNRTVANLDQQQSHNQQQQQLALFENSSLWKLFVRPQRIISCLGIDNRFLKLSSVHSKESLLANPAGKTFNDSSKSSLSLQTACRSSSSVGGTHHTKNNHHDFDSVETMLWSTNNSSSTKTAKSSSSSSEKDSTVITLNKFGGKEWKCLEHWPILKLLSSLSSDEPSSSSHIITNKKMQYFGHPECGVCSVVAASRNSSSSIGIDDDNFITVRPAIVVELIPNNNNSTSSSSSLPLEMRWGSFTKKEDKFSIENRRWSSLISHNHDDNNNIIDTDHHQSSNSFYSIPNFNGSEEALEDTNFQLGMDLRAPSQGSSAPSSPCRITFAQLLSSVSVSSSSPSSSSAETSSSADSGSSSSSGAKHKQILLMKPQLFCMDSSSSSVSASQQQWIEISSTLRRGTLVVIVRLLSQAPILPVNTLPYEMRIRRANPAYKDRNSQDGGSSSLSDEYVVVPAKHTLLPHHQQQIANLFKPSHSTSKKSQHLRVEFWSPSANAAQNARYLNSQHGDGSNNINLSTATTASAQHQSSSSWGSWLASWVGAGGGDSSSSSSLNNNNNNAANTTTDYSTSSNSSSSTNNNNIIIKSPPPQPDQELLAVAVIEPFDAAESKISSERKVVATPFVTTSSKNKSLPSISVVAHYQFSDQNNNNNTDTNTPQQNNIIRLTSCLTEQVGIIASSSPQQQRSINDTSVYLFQCRIDKLLATTDSGSPDEERSRGNANFVRITTLCENANLSAHSTYHQSTQTAETAVRASLRSFDVAQQILSSSSSFSGSSSSNNSSSGFASFFTSSSSSQQQKDSSSLVISAPLTLMPLNHHQSSDHQKNNNNKNAAKTATTSNNINNTTDCCFSLQSDGVASRFTDEYGLNPRWIWNGRSTRIALGQVIVDFNDSTARALAPLVSSFASASPFVLPPSGKRLSKTNNDNNKTDHRNVSPSSSSSSSKKSNNSNNNTNSTSSIGNVTIEPISLDITLRQLGSFVQKLSRALSSKRNNNNNTTTSSIANSIKILRTIGDIEHASISISRFISSDFNNNTTGTKSIPALFTSHATREVILQLPLILGSLASLGNPTGLVRDLVRSVATLADEAILQQKIVGGAFHFVRDIAGTALHSAALVTRSSGKLLMFASGNGSGDSSSSASNYDDDEDEGDDTNSGDEQHQHMKMRMTNLLSLAVISGGHEDENDTDDNDTNNSFFFIQPIQNNNSYHPNQGIGLSSSSVSSSSLRRASSSGHHHHTRGAVSIVTGAVTRPVALLLQGVGSFGDYVSSVVETNPEISITTSSSVKARLQAAQDERHLRNNNSSIMGGGNKNNNNSSASKGSNHHNQDGSSSIGGASASSSAATANRHREELQQQYRQQQSGFRNPYAHHHHQSSTMTATSTSDGSIRRIAPHHHNIHHRFGTTSEQSFGSDGRHSSIRSLHLMSGTSASSLSHQLHASTSAAGQTQQQQQQQQQSSSLSASLNNNVLPSPALRRQIVQSLVHATFEKIIDQQTVSSNATAAAAVTKEDKVMHLLQSLLLGSKGSAEDNQDGNNQLALIFSAFIGLQLESASRHDSSSGSSAGANQQQEDINKNAAIQLLMTSTETVRNMIMLWVSTHLCPPMLSSSNSHNIGTTSASPKNLYLDAVERSCKLFLKEKYRQERLFDFEHYQQTTPALQMNPLCCPLSRRQRALTLKHSLGRNNNEKVVAAHVGDEAAMVTIAQSWREALVSSPSYSNNKNERSDNDDDKKEQQELLLPLAYQEWIMAMGFLQPLQL